MVVDDRIEYILGYEDGVEGFVVVECVRCVRFGVFVGVCVRSSMKLQNFNPLNMTVKGLFFLLETGESEINRNLQVVGYI